MRYGSDEGELIRTHGEWVRGMKREENERERMSKSLQFLLEWKSVQLQFD